MSETDLRTDTLRGWSSERYEYGGELVTEILDESEITFGDIPLQNGATVIRASYPQPSGWAWSAIAKSG